MNQPIRFSLRAAWLVALAFSFLQVSATAVPSEPLVKEMDAKSRLEIERPASWFIQDKPNAATRFMYGFERPGYAGNCNINILASASTAQLNQAAVDESENRKTLSKAFFEQSLKSAFEDVSVSTALQTQIGDKWGHLVEYSYSYVEPSANKIVHMRSVMFSHSRPGNVLTFSCSLGTTSAKSASTAATALKKELPAFNHMVATSRFVSAFDGFNIDPTLLKQVPRVEELNAFDRWRYNSCRESATKAPTAVGVNRGIRLCDEKFGQ